MPELLTRIREAYDRLTKRERMVADYVLANPREVLNLTLSELAIQCGVGDTTVFRFCKSMKLDGYQDFKMSLALCTNTKKMLDIETNLNVSDSKDVVEVSGKILGVYRNALEAAYEQLDFDAISHTVDKLLTARLIYVFGFSGSGVVAAMMQNKFAKILPNVNCPGDSHMQLTAAALLTPQDMCVIFCNSGITIDCIRLAQLSHEAGAFTAFATSLLTTPAAQYADALLPCGAMEGPMQGGSISVTASQMLTVDILYAEAFRKLGQKAEAHKELTAQAIVHKMM